MLARKPKLRGSRAKGITYEKHVGRALTRWQQRGELQGEIILNQWFSFTDDNGHGYCQPDIIILTPSLAFILECKLTFTDWAWPQLKHLYKPVVEHVYQRPAIITQVCKHIYYNPPGQIESIQELIDSPKDRLNTWHFLGA